MEFRDTSVLITGAASGIGRSLALALARKGADLALIDIDPAQAQETAESVRAEGRRAEVYGADVSQQGDVEAAVGAAWDDLGPIGLACANAGVCPVAQVMDFEVSNLEWVMGVNLYGVFHTARAYVSRLRDAGAEGGHIMLTGSENSVSLPHALRRIGLGPYCMTKHAVLGLAESLRYELAPENIGISILMPGPVATAINEGARKRPERLGGAFAPDAMDVSLLDPNEPFPPTLQPDAVARIAVEGLEADRFMIPTHSHLAAYGQARQDELDAATAASHLEPNT